MFRIAVCEDNPLQLETILALLGDYQVERPGLNVRSFAFTASRDVLASVDGGERYSLFLLDILLPDMNGIELAREIRTTHPEAPLVFFTVTAEYALDAFKVSAAQYILKPVRKEELFPVLDRAAAAQKRERERFFMVSTQKKSVKIPYRSIVCVELAGRALQIYLDNGDILLSKTIRKPFAEALAPLLEDGRFLCGHKSYAMNMEHIKEVGKSSFIMAGGLEVPVPRYNYAKSKARYFQWLKEQSR